MIGLVYVWIVFCARVHASLLEGDTPTTRQHPERMLARLRAEQHEIRKKIGGSSALSTGTKMPIMVLDGEAHGTIQSLGLEGCTLCFARVRYATADVQS